MASADKPRKGEHGNRIGRITAWAGLVCGLTAIAIALHLGPPIPIRSVPTIIQIRWDEGPAATLADFTARIDQLLSQLGVPPTVRSEQDHWIAELDKPRSHVVVEYQLGSPSFWVRREDFDDPSTLIRWAGAHRLTMLCTFLGASAVLLVISALSLRRR